MRVVTICAFALAVSCKRHVVPAQPDDAPKKPAFVHAVARSAEPLPANAIGVFVALDGVRASVDGPLLGTFHRQEPGKEEPTIADGIDTSELEPALDKLDKQIDAANPEPAFHVDARAERAIVHEVLALVARISSRPVWLVVEGGRAIPVRGVPPAPAHPQNENIPHPGPSLSDDPDMMAWELIALAGGDAGPPPKPKPKPIASISPSASAAPTPVCGVAPLDASITVRDEGYFVSGFGAPLGADCTHAGAGPAVLAKDGKLDDEALSRCLARLKGCSATYASEQTITVSVRDKRDFQSFVRTLDAIRSSFATIRIRAM